MNGGQGLRVSSEPARILAQLQGICQLQSFGSGIEYDRVHEEPVCSQQQQMFVVRHLRKLQIVSGRSAQAGPAQYHGSHRQIQEPAR